MCPDLPPPLSPLNNAPGTTPTLLTSLSIGLPPSHPEARVSAAVHAPFHPGAGEGEAGGPGGEVQRAVRGLLPVPRPALAAGHLHRPVRGAAGDVHRQHRRAQQVRERG